MRELSKQRQAYPRRTTRASGDVWETRGESRGDSRGDSRARERMGAIGKPRKLMEQAWRDALQYLDDSESASLRGMRPVGKGRLR